jgi:hypothetical protein
MHRAKVWNYGVHIAVGLLDVDIFVEDDISGSYAAIHEVGNGPIAGGVIPTRDGDALRRRG